MALELISRLLAVVLAIAFTLALTRGQIPGIPKGIWTFLALFAVGFGLCTIGGIRDGLGTSVVSPTWLTVLNGGLGIASMLLLAAIPLGLSPRLGVALLAVAAGTSWLAALVFAISAGLSSAPLGIVTLAVITVSVFAIAWPSVAHRTPALHPNG